MSKIPAIPPISSVQDRAARDALQALTEGWQLRNGMTGSGDYAFITKADVIAIMEKASTTNKVMLEDAKNSSFNQSNGNTNPTTQQQGTGEIFVLHPTLGRITLQQWLDSHVDYTNAEHNWVESNLANLWAEVSAIKARLSAGGL